LNPNREKSRGCGENSPVSGNFRAIRTTAQNRFPGASRETGKRTRTARVHLIPRVQTRAAE
jgi:hypothetical protein